MPNFRQLAMNLIGQNPNIANNPQAKQMLDVIQSGNNQEGQRIADNLCNTMGVSRVGFSEKIDEMERRNKIL